MDARWIALAVLLAGCPSSAGRKTSSPDAGGPGSASGGNTHEGPCPTIDHAKLEPAKEHPDSRTIELVRVFQREEARADLVIAPAPYDLDVTRVKRMGPGPKLGSGMGMGWMMVQPSWVASAISPEVEAPLAAWDAAWKVLGEHQRGSYLLDSRVQVARSVAPPKEWGGLHCVEQAAAQADRDQSEAGAAVEHAAEELLRVLEALPSRKPGDELLLGYLLAEQLEYPYEPKEAERSIASFTTVANDEAVDRELRARAAEQLARVGGMQSDGFAPALEQVLSLTQDPELTVETLVKLADIAEHDGDANKAEALRVRIMEQLGPGGESWRAAQTLASLAAARLDRGALELARDDAARCAQETAVDSAREPDPWGCAPVLAEALAELAEAPVGVTVPLPFLGPLAIASMDSALQRHDHEQAKHVGMLLLKELPEAAEAPEAIAILMGIVQTEDERTKLAATKAREYGLDGEWAEQQRRRLAWENEPEEVERQLAALLEPTRRPVVVHVPTTPAELTTELRERARLVAESCADVLAKKRRPASISVDTTGTTPVATVKGAKKAAEACLRRSTESRFRSVGPVRISFGVVLE